MVTNQPAIFLVFQTLTDQGPWVLMEISVPFFLLKYLNTDLHRRHQRGHKGKTQTLKMLTFSLQECRFKKANSMFLKSRQIEIICIMKML